LAYYWHLRQQVRLGYNLVKGDEQDKLLLMIQSKDLMIQQQQMQLSQKEHVLIVDSLKIDSLITASKDKILKQNR
jgi:hypothetical protein